MLSVAGTIAQSHHLLPAKCQSLNVRFGSKADIDAHPRNVRFTPKSGHWNSVVECPLCAMCGRLLVGKKNLRVADLVGAAMCSAF
jgi:hypothetical protein